VKQLSRLLLATLLYSLVISVAHAMAMDVFLTPGKLTDGPINFTVKVDRLKDGNLLVRVLITHKGGKFAANANTCLAMIKQDKNGFVSSGTRLRALPSEKNELTISCVFVVPEKSIEEPDLFFQFQDVERASGTCYNLGLKALVNFYKP
jgi:hypothetical protein